MLLSSLLYNAKEHLMLNTEKIEKLVNAINGLSQYAQKKDQKQVILSSEQINRLIQMFEYAEVGENPYTPQYFEYSGSR